MPPKPTTPRICADCPADISDRHYNAKLCIPCASERQRKQIRKHKSKPQYKAQQRKYRSTPEYKALKRAYDAKPEHKARASAYHKTPKAKARERNRNRKRRSTPEFKTYMRIYGRKYRATPKGREVNRIASHRHRARKNGVLLGVKTSNIHLIRAQEQGNKCYWCSKPFTAKLRRPTEDHYIPLSKGGPDDDSNIIAACQSCNSSKGAKDPVDYAQSTGRLL